MNDNSVPQVSIRFDRNALALNGLKAADLAQTVQAAFYGTRVSDFIEQQN